MLRHLLKETCQGREEQRGILRMTITCRAIPGSCIMRSGWTSTRVKNTRLLQEYLCVVEETHDSASVLQAISFRDPSGRKEQQRRDISVLHPFLLLNSKKRFTFIITPKSNRIIISSPGKVSRHYTPHPCIHFSEIGCLPIKKCI